MRQKCSRDDRDVRGARSETSLFDLRQGLFCSSNTMNKPPYCLLAPTAFPTTGPPPSLASSVKLYAYNGDNDDDVHPTPLLAAAHARVWRTRPSTACTQWTAARKPPATRVHIRLPAATAAAGVRKVPPPQGEGVSCHFPICRPREAHGCARIVVQRRPPVVRQMCQSRAALCLRP